MSVYGSVSKHTLGKWVDCTLHIDTHCICLYASSYTFQECTRNCRLCHYTVCMYTKSSKHHTVYGCMGNYCASVLRSVTTFHAHGCVGKSCLPQQFDIVLMCYTKHLLNEQLAIRVTRRDIHIHTYTHVHT